MNDFDKILKNLGAAIKKIRKDKGLTAVELGFKTDMDKPNINRIESGKTNPTILTLIRICTALEIELVDLFKEIQIKP